MSTCSGCGGVIQSKHFLDCCICNDFYDLECLNISESNFLKFNEDYKCQWVCPACVSSQPKGDNTCTPARSTVISDYTNINVTRGSRVPISPSDSQTATGEYVSPPPPINLELNRLKDEVCDLKKQNTVILNMLSDVSQSVKQMLCEYSLGLKNKEDEISLLKESVVQLRNKLSQYEQIQAVDGNNYAKRTSVKAIVDKCNDSASTNKPKKQTKASKPFPSFKQAGTTIVPEVVERDPPTTFILDPLSISVQKGESDVEDDDKTHQDATTAEEWTEVINKRTRTRLSNVLRGTATPGSTTLEASTKWSYLHLYFVKLGTPKEQVSDHLKTILGDSEIFTVETLKARGQYASFKIGVSIKHATKVLNASNWAENICIKYWKQNFRSRKTENEVQKN